IGETGSDTCRRCGAWRGQLGLEPSVEMYMDHLMATFRELKRVLRPDGVLWVNLDDKYAGSNNGAGGSPDEAKEVYQPDRVFDSAPEVPEKSMYAIPERFVLRMLKDGWV
ncbi:MAG: hypothetical protein ABEK12_01865, partial [Candidatus Nanohaloarchaea archaeon]